MNDNHSAIISIQLIFLHAHKALFWLFYVVFCAFLWLKNPLNLRNSWFIHDLRAFNVLYNCRYTFTDVMSALQINLFMQNKPNFRKSQMNVTKVLTKEYVHMDTWSSGKNKPNTNPIQSQFKPNSNPIKAKTNPIQTQSNPISEGKNGQKA
jgi:hypothetical protein